MRGLRRLLALSLIVVSGCLPESCDDDCYVNGGDADCVANNNPTGISMPPSPPPPPLTLECRTRNTEPDPELEWELGIGGGAPPFTYTVSFGDETPAEQGSWSGSSTPPRGRHEYQRPGDFNVTGQVRDAAGQTQACALAYSAPVPDLRLSCTITPTTGTAPLTVSFDVPPGGRRGCVGPCTVSWDFGDGETAEGGHAVHEYTLPGPTFVSTYTAFGRLSDGLDREARCRVPVQVLADTNTVPTDNHPPVVDTLQFTPSTIGAGQAATLTGTTSDPDPGDSVSWSLSFSGTSSVGTLSPTSGSGPIAATYTSLSTTSGTVIVQVTAVDSHGAVTYRNVGVTVTPSTVNQPPAIVSLSANPSTIFVGIGAAQIVGSFTDPDNDPLTWTLALDPSSTASGNLSATSGSGNALSASFSATGSGQAVIRATVRDPSGLTDTRTVNVNVVLGKQ